MSFVIIDCNVLPKKVIDSIKDIEPREDENKHDFISRFMSETKSEYPDEEQRLAVAYSYWDKSKGKDSMKDRINCNDSAASNIVNEIKSKYPQVRIKMYSKKDGKFNFANLKFSNYPGEGASGFSNDPRTKDRGNWEKFLKYIYKKYFPQSDVEPYYYELNIYERIKDSVNDNYSIYSINNGVETKVGISKGRSVDDALNSFLEENPNYKEKLLVVKQKKDSLQNVCKIIKIINKVRR